MLPPSKVIKEYRITEKATDLSANQNKYTFEVFPNVNRIEVKHAISKMFSVEVESVNILNQKGKSKRSRTVRGQTGTTRSMKKAVVTLKQGHAIEIV